MLSLLGVLETCIQQKIDSGNFSVREYDQTSIPVIVDDVEEFKSLIRGSVGSLNRGESREDFLNNLMVYVFLVQAYRKGRM